MAGRELLALELLTANSALHQLCCLKALGAPPCVNLKQAEICVVRAAINACLAVLSPMKLALQLTSRRTELRRGLRNLARCALIRPYLGRTRVAHEEAITVRPLAHVANCMGLGAHAASGVDEALTM